MKRTILAGILIVAAGGSGLMAQKSNPKGAPAQAGQQKGPVWKSKAEQDAVVAMFNAQSNPDQLIAAAEKVTKSVLPSVDAVLPLIRQRQTVLLAALAKRSL